MIKLIIDEKIDREDILKKELKIEKVEIKKTIHGKPYINGFPIYFSFSDTSKKEGIVISDKNVGLDIQKIENKRNYLKIAKRVFNKDEIEYVTKYGIEGFYTIWTRMESLVKFNGSGIFYNRPSVINNQITIDNESVYFYTKKMTEYMISICSLEEIKDGNI